LTNALIKYIISGSSNTNKKRSMTRKETRVQRIVRLTSKRFPEFAKRVERVDVEQIIRFVLTKRGTLESTQRQKIGNDARDISYTSGLLEPLPSKVLESFQHLKRREIKHRLRSNDYPFSRLNKKEREELLHLPISWLREGALWQLNSRKPAILLLHR